MRRVFLIVATVGILCVAANQVQAHDPGRYDRRHHHGYRGAVVHPPIWSRPTVVLPAPVYPPAVYGPAYPYQYYYPGPSFGFYYQNRGLSIGVGF